jgi:hypothetical protein
MKRRFTGISERDVMKLPRRNFLHLAAGAAALPAVPRFRFGASLSDTIADCEGVLDPNLILRKTP